MLLDGHDPLAYPPTQDGIPHTLSSWTRHEETNSFAAEFAVPAFSGDDEEGWHDAQVERERGFDVGVIIFPIRAWLMANKTREGEAVRARSVFMPTRRSATASSLSEGEFLVDDDFLGEIDDGAELREEIVEVHFGGGEAHLVENGCHGV